MHHLEPPNAIPENYPNINKISRGVTSISRRKSPCWLGISIQGSGFLFRKRVWESTVFTGFP